MSYRYALRRDLGLPFSTRLVLWLMLNPSKALTDASDAAEGDGNDPTIRKCIGFSKRWGFGRLAVVNLFAFRATKPREMWLARYNGFDIVGPENDEAILAADREADMVVCAWGRLPKHGFERRDAVLQLLDHRRELYGLGRNGDGSPAHPLMAPYAEPIIWRHKEGA